ncbi:MAG: acyl-CoA thioesterase [Acidobacteria bacterium]|nr:acyl-CoA thioesterase [Acidobacteriota bacterium]
MNDQKIFRYSGCIPWMDADPAGILYFGNYFKLFELVEFDFYRSLDENWKAFLDDHQIYLARAEVHCRYLRPIAWDARIEVHLQVVRLSTRSVTYRFKIYSSAEKELLTEATVIVVCVARKDFRPTPFPESLSKLLREYREALD